MTKKQSDEFVVELEAYLLAHGDRVAALLEESRIRAVNAAWAAEAQARLNREREQNGTPEPQPDTRPRVVALKSFQHRGDMVEIGSVWLKDHDCVRSAPNAFADVQD